MENWLRLFWEHIQLHPYEVIHDIGLFALPAAAITYLVGFARTRRAVTAALEVDLKSTSGAFEALIPSIRDALAQAGDPVAIHADSLAPGLTTNAQVVSFLRRLPGGFLVTGLITSPSNALELFAADRAKRLVVIDDRIKLFQTLSDRYSDCILHGLERAAGATGDALADQFTMELVSRAMSRLRALAECSHVVLLRIAEARSDNQALDRAKKIGQEFDALRHTPALTPIAEVATTDVAVQPAKKESEK